MAAFVESGSSDGDVAVVMDTPSVPPSPVRGPAFGGGPRETARHKTVFVIDSNAVGVGSARCCIRPRAHCEFEGGAGEMVAEYTGEDCRGFTDPIPLDTFGSRTVLSRIRLLSVDDVDSMFVRGLRQRKVVVHHTDRATWMKLLEGPTTFHMEPIKRWQSWQCNFPKLRTKTIQAARKRHRSAIDDVPERTMRKPLPKTRSFLAKSLVQKRILKLHHGIATRNRRTAKDTMARALAYLHNSMSVLDDTLEEDSNVQAGMYNTHEYVKCDVLACMLQREEIRNLGPHAEFNLVFDSSPKGGCEAFGAVLEISRRTARGEVEPVKRINLSGATLRQGCYGTYQKTFTLLWCLYLQVGPPLNYFRSKLRQVRCATTDCGVERLVAFSKDCLDAWSHWVRGELGPGPRIDRVKSLFESIVWIPDWNHLWSNLIHTVFKALKDWPSFLENIRNFVKFFKVRDYRTKIARRLRNENKRVAAFEFERPFRASFAHWRFETLVECLQEIHRLRPFLMNVHKSDFGKLQEATLLDAVASLCNNPDFLGRCSAHLRWSALAEKARKWGNWCECCDPKQDRLKPCLHRGHRLHKARGYVQGVVDELLRMREQLGLGLRVLMLKLN